MGHLQHLWAQVAVKRDQDAQCFTSYCPALDLYSAGNSESEAVLAIGEAVGMFVRNCTDRGILETVLARHKVEVVIDAHEDDVPWAGEFERFGGKRFMVAVQESQGSLLLPSVVRG